MKGSKLLLLVLFSWFVAGTAAAQTSNATLYGQVTDSLGKPLDLVNVSLKGYPLGTVTDRQGNYLLRIPARQSVTLSFSAVGFQKQEHTVTAPGEERLMLNVMLTQSNQQLGEVTVTRQHREQNGMTLIDPTLAASLPGASANSVEALIKTLPGVSSNNELSARYSVRGGNFDENLVYVNDIEIYRPFLVRSGQQEGLSFINPDLVSSIRFSAGGFDARYGDKMASVLDIRYRRPTGFAGSASASMLGGSLHLEDASRDQRFSYLAGVRYKTNQYLLNSLDESGDYNPRFTDLQGFVTYRCSEVFELSALGNLSRNQYHFVPQTRETSFGTWQTPLQTKIYFEGQEKDRFDTWTAALTGNYHPNEQLNLKWIASAFATTEEINYDILGQYYLNELEQDLASGRAGDSVLNLGVGSFLQHARNNLRANVFNLEHKGALNSDKHLLNWGIKVQHERIHDKMNEWELRDSAGFSIPYSDEQVLLYRTAFTNNRMHSVRLSAYLQDTYALPVKRGELFLTAGMRTQYWDESDEWLLSPRASLSYYPDWQKPFVFRLSGGNYHQAAFFKEMKDRDGQIHPRLKAQRSRQVVLGADHLFRAWDRPFTLSTELFYKHYSRLVPYQTENVQIRYLADQQASGYAAGFDMKVNGEFVSGMQSWLSLSLLQTREDIVNDGHGWIPRPTDQLLNFNLYFQDYLPGNPSWKMHLTLFYGSRLPIGPPNSERWQDTFRMPPYRRIDLGFTKVLISPERKNATNKLLSGVKDMWLSFEVLNLPDIKNTISYFWVSSLYGDQFAVPNYLTGRKVNLKLTVRF